MAITKLKIRISDVWYEGELHEDLTASRVIEALIEGKKLNNVVDYQLCYILSANDRPSRLIQKAGNQFVVLHSGSTEVTEMVAADPKRVFVVCGRASKICKDLFSFLRAIGLNPIEWGMAIDETGSGAPFIGDIINTGFRMAQAAIILMTGDDVAKLRKEYIKEDDPSYESRLTPQPRQNVLFEAGMAYGLYPERTILVTVGKLRHFSDIDGRHVIRLDNSSQKRKELAQRLERAGCTVTTRGDHWLEIGDFG